MAACKKGDSDASCGLREPCSDGKDMDSESGADDNDDDEARRHSNGKNHSLHTKNMKSG
jgi:hypothetical protein